MRRSLLVFGCALAAATFVVGGAPAAQAVSGSLDLRAEVRVRYPQAQCPAGTPRLIECFARAGESVVPGLGKVEESYEYLLENAPPGCTAAPGADAVRHPPTTARLTVPGKGEILLITAGTGCLNRAGTLRSSEPFTIVGGTGIYAGASGGGTLESQSNGPPAFNGFDTWTGSLIVPGLEFDVVAPTITGAIDNTVRIARRAKAIRVNYAVSARDDVDGVVPVTCVPKSGARFDVGRTRVTCSATDKSGNAQTAAFTVRVMRRR